jgi:hypothetical protein
MKVPFFKENKNTLIERIVQVTYSFERFNIAIGIN